MKQNVKRLLSLFLCLSMLLSLLPVTVAAAGSTETDSGSATPSVADAFGFKTDPPAGYDANDGVHPFSQSGTNDTINMVPVKEVGLLATHCQYGSVYDSSINVYNFDADSLASFSDATKLFTNSYSFAPGDKDKQDEFFRVASGVAYDPTGSGRDDHVFYYGPDISIRFNDYESNYLPMKDYSYEGGKEGIVASGRLNPNEENNEKNEAYAWATYEDLVDEAPDKYLSVIAGNFNGNGKETVVLYDPQYGHFTLRECSVNEGSIQTGLVYDLGNEIEVANTRDKNKLYTLNGMVSAQRNNYGNSRFPAFMPLVHMTAGDLDGDEKDELVVTVTPLTLELSGYYFDCVSTVLIFNKENDGEGNAVWNLKASTSGAHATAIGDFNKDNKNELILVARSEIKMMQYSKGSLTTLGGSTSFLNKEFAPYNSEITPIYNVPVVGVALMDGTGTDPYLYISGEIFRYSADRGEFYEVFDVATSMDYLYENPVRRQPIIGNFDGNTAGKEQIFTAVHGAKLNGDQVYGIECYSTGGDGPRLSYSYSESDADALGRMVLTAPDADTDDGLVMRYTSKEYVFSNPEVMAVLLASPYFEDLLDDYENIGVTGFGTSNSTGSSYANTVTNTVGAYVSFSQDISILGMVDVASVEFQAAYNYEWSKTNEVSHTYETAISYEAGSGSNQVVMIATPVILYHYDVLGRDGAPVATHEVSVSQQPCYTVIPVEDYNASAELLGNPVIDSNCVTSVVPGQPQTYPSSKWQIDSVGGVCVPFDTPVLTSQSNAVVSQEVDREQSKSLTTSYSHNIEVSGGAGAGGFVIGASYSYSKGSDKTETVTSEVSRSGSVANIPAGNPDYSFKWQFATWDIQVGGYKAPVMGYIVNDVYQPPSIPQNLTATPGSDSVELTWDHGYNAAVKYDLFRYYPDEKEEYQYDLIGTVDGTETGFVCEGLNPSTRYYFTIRAVGDQGLRSGYAEPVAVTTISPDQKLPEVKEQPVDRTVNVSNSRQTTFSTLANPTSGGTVTYAWECREDSSSAWETISGGTNVSGYNTRTLTVYNITESMDGTQYRCRISERSGAPYPAVIYTNIATLTVGKAETETKLTAPTNGSYGILNGAPVSLMANVAASDNSACSGNMSFRITDTATGVTETLTVKCDDNGTATVDWILSTAGVYTIKAVYVGDETTEGSASETITYYVQADPETPCYEITLSGDLVYGEAVTPSLKQVSRGQSTDVDGANFVLYKYNGTEFVIDDSDVPVPGDYRIEAALGSKVVARKVFTVNKRPITITAPQIDPIAEGDPFYLKQYNEKIDYSYEIEKEFKSLFILSGVTAEYPISGQYDISVIYMNPNDDNVSDFLSKYQPTFEKSIFTVIPSIVDENMCKITFSSGINGDVKAYVSATSTKEITASPSNISKGSTVFFSPEAKEGFMVSKWRIDNKKVTQKTINNGTFTEYGNVRFSGDGLIIEGIKKDIDVRVEFINENFIVKFFGSDGGNVTAVQGSTELSSPVEICSGTNITFTAVPEDKKVVKSWTITHDNKTTETIKNPDDTNYTGTTLTLENISENLTVQVEFEDYAEYQVIYGAVIYNPEDEEYKKAADGLVSITADGLNEKQQGVKGSAITLTANTKPGTKIMSWEVYENGSWVTKAESTEVFTIYNLQAEMSIRVVLNPSSITYKVEYEIEGFSGESIGNLSAVTGEETVPSENECIAYSSITFTYEESDICELVCWKVNGIKVEVSSNETKHTYTISSLNADTKVIAVIQEKPTVSVSDNIENGSISVTYKLNDKSVTPTEDGHIKSGTIAIITAKPNDNYVVDKITGQGNEILDGDKTSGEKTVEYTVNENTVFSAAFLEKPTVTYGCSEKDSLMVSLDGSETVISSGAYVEFGSSVIFTTAPDEGYKVKGWYSDAAFTTPIEGTADQNSYTIENLNADVSVYVEFELITYTITFDTDGGTEIDPITLAPGTTVTSPADPTKTGYTFKGWYESEDLTGDTYLFTTMPAEDITLYAKWQINQYTITFDTDGGTMIAPITQDYGTDVTAPAEPTKTGYTFADWDKDIPATMPAENMTITAQWTINQYTITFNTNGGSAIAPITQDYGTVVTAPENPTKVGYDFGGWYEDEDLISAFVFTEGKTMPAYDITLYAKWNPQDGIKYTVNHKLENPDGSSYTTESEVKYGMTGTETAAEAKTVEGFTAGEVIQQTIKGDGTTVVEIIYTRNTHTVTFKPENGEDDIVTNVKYGTAIIAPSIDRTGYTLTGWDPQIPDTMPDENMTFTAQWQINQYTITFDTDGGTTVDSITQDYGTAVTAPADPTKTGYTFTGWDQEIPETMPAEDMTITAQWEAIQYTITVESIGEGHISASRDTAQVGGDIVVTVTPHDDNHRLDTLTVTDAEGNSIPVEYRENEGKYRFKMPAANVTVKAVFVCKVHDTVLNDAEEATCEKDGHIAYYTCSSCGLWFEDAEATKVIDDHDSVIIPAGHSYVDVVTDPTCTTQGYTTHTCSVCGDSYVDTDVDALGHSWDDGVVTKEATCTEEGVKTFTCKTCGEIKTEAIEALGHDYQNGKCTICGEKDPNTKPSWKDWFDKIFGDWWGDDEEECNHVYTSVVIAPTCEEQGYTTHTCSECGDTYKDSYTDALGHSWDEGKITKEPTCTENGEKTFTCATCDATKTEKIDALGHQFENGTCTKCGEKEASEPENPNNSGWEKIWDWISGWWN